ncbi:transporter [Leptolyngbya sp. 'hensonii']|uniref:TOBE domain-containing protein n=1 Tax=Leptolyngbya sp. 'hensonii' TaxID=1922337 RepID=UPI00094FDB00|nr:molybdopterin-binding protein [Leptolyngbya sp. 'hensonii']OLP16343.1 transporter [Leptolyngbya sp. 'hensonii']
MPRKEQGWVTFQTSEEERRILEAFCQQSQRTKTEILRELVRSLNQEHQSTEEQLPAVSSPMSPLPFEDKHTDLEAAPTKRPLKVSSRNILKGVVTQVITGSVNSEVTLEIVHRVQLTSIITKTSAEQLGLAAGKEAYAVIKSSDVVIAMD